jgi:hypothetical protein
MLATLPSLDPRSPLPQCEICGLAPRRLPHVSGDGDHHYLRNGDMLENAQAMAARESPRTTKLHDRTSDEITLDEVERVAI